MKKFKYQIISAGVVVSSGTTVGRTSRQAANVLADFQHSIKVVLTTVQGVVYSYIY